MSSLAMTTRPSVTASPPTSSTAHARTNSVSFAWFTTAGHEPPSKRVVASAR